jgi:hypothetical protein
VDCEIHNEKVEAVYYTDGDCIMLTEGSLPVCCSNGIITAETGLNLPIKRMRMEEHLVATIWSLFDLVDNGS